MFDPETSAVIAAEPVPHERSATEWPWRPPSAVGKISMPCRIGDEQGMRGHDVDSVKDARDARRHALSAGVLVIDGGVTGCLRGGRGSSVEAVIERYDQAWNTSEVDERRRLLEAALTDDCEMVEPRGRFLGRQAILERISGFSDRFPGARVDITTNVDEHNGFARYGWRILDREGTLLLDGIDVVERAADGRLCKVVMFFGMLQPA